MTCDARSRSGGFTCGLWRKLVPLGALVTAGCLSLEPLREHRYAALTVEHLEVAGDSEDERVFDGVVGLLSSRLESPKSVDLDIALEAVAALMHIGRVDGVPVLKRCAREDPAEEMRYFALEALVRLDAEAATETLAAVAREDASGLVREQASELLGPQDRR